MMRRVFGACEIVNFPFTYHAVRILNITNSGLYQVVIKFDRSVVQTFLNSVQSVFVTFFGKTYTYDIPLNS